MVDAYTVLRDGIPDDGRPDAPAAGDPRSRRPARGRTDGTRGPRRLRRSGRLLAAVAGFAAGSVLAGAGGVWASHQFSDVPGSHQFHGDIDWLVDHDIAAGYDDGTFKPTAPVSRQAAARY